MGFLLSLQSLDQREDRSDEFFASTVSTSICLSTASTAICR
jgi:hypothetical protein